MKKVTETIDEFFESLCNEFDMDKLLDLRRVYSGLIHEYLAKEDIGDTSKSIAISIANKRNLNTENKNINTIAFEILRGIYSRVLKKKLGYSDSVIDVILYNVLTIDNITEIYVYDDKVVFETSSKEKGKSKIVKPTVAKRFIDITSSDFYINGDKNLLNFIIQSINNSVGGLFSGETGITKLLKIENNRINYDISNLEILINHSFNDLASNPKDDIKLQVKSGNIEYYFKMKVSNDYVTLIQYEPNVDCLSEKLGTATQK